MKSGAQKSPCDPALEGSVAVGRPQPVVSDLEGLAVGHVVPAGHPVALEARVAVRPPCDFVGREQVPARSSVLPCPRPLTSFGRPRVYLSFSRGRCSKGLRVYVCSFNAVPLLLAEIVQLLCDGRTASHHLQVELPEVLVEQSHRDVLGSHVRRISRAWKLPNRKKTSRLLLLDPQYVDLDMPQLCLCTMPMAALASMPMLALISGHPKTLRRVKIPSASVDARTTA